jgi:hypothetical protein
MPCFIILIALFMPRLALFLIWLFSDWLGRAYDTVLWPLLGFFFMPYTTLAYMAGMLNNDGHISGGWLALVVFCALIDLGAWGGSRKMRKWKSR